MVHAYVISEKWHLIVMRWVIILPKQAFRALFLKWRGIEVIGEGEKRRQKNF